MTHTARHVFAPLLYLKSLRPHLLRAHGTISIMQLHSMLKAVIYNNSDQIIVNKVIFTNDGIKKEKVILAYRYNNG